MSAVDKVVAEVTGDYAGYTANVLKANAELIATIVAEIEAKGGLDAVSDFFYDVTDEIKDKLGSEAADLLDRPADKNEARNRIDAWVADNIANAGTEANVVAATWGYGPKQVVEDIRAELAKVTSPSP